MSQTIQCRTCKAETTAESIADLISAHTNAMGRFPCGDCGGADTFIHRDKHPEWKGRAERWIRGIVPIETKTADAGHSPFVFLTADAADGDVTGIEFKYYWTARPNGRGRKPGGRTDGGAALTQAQLLSLVKRLARIGIVSTKDWRGFLRDLEGAPVSTR